MQSLWQFLTYFPWFQTLPPEQQKIVQQAIASGELGLGQYRLLENIFVPVDLAQALILIKLIKTPEGQRLAEKFGEKWLDTQARMVVALAESGTGNIITAWAHSHLIAMMLEHNYMIRKGGAGGLVAGMNWLTGAVTLAEIIGDINVPSTLVFSGGATPLGRRGMSALLGK